MTRKLKTLGLAFMAVIAISATAASAASADWLTGETAFVSLTGKQTGAGDVFTTTAGTVKCKQASYKSPFAESTPAASVTLTPSYPAKTSGGEQNCTAFGFPAEVTTNGCEYEFWLGPATFGSVEVFCPIGKEITVTAVSAGVTKCVVHIGHQANFGITYSNTGAGSTREMNMAASIVNTLDYKHTAGSGVGSCTSGSSGSGSYTGSAIVTGESVGTHVGIFLS